MPAASSLFSRLYGRYDLAWFLAKSLARASGAKFIVPPRAFYFSLEKRSRKKREEELFPLFSLLKPQEGKPRLLLVDDVLTTGYTLKALAKHYEGSFSLQAVTLAYARRLSSNRLGTPTSSMLEQLP